MQTPKILALDAVLIGIYVLDTQTVVIIAW